MQESEPPGTRQLNIHLGGPTKRRGFYTGMKAFVLQTTVENVWKIFEMSTRWISGVALPVNQVSWWCSCISNHTQMLGKKNRKGTPKESCSEPWEGFRNVELICMKAAGFDTPKKYSESFSLSRAAHLYCLSNERAVVTRERTRQGFT